MKLQVINLNKVLNIDHAPNFLRWVLISTLCDRQKPEEMNPLIKRCPTYKCNLKDLKKKTSWKNDEEMKLADLNLKLIIKPIPYVK